jgi:hypothetical protein
MKLAELFKLPSTKRKEALEAKRLKEQAYIKAEEARLEHATKQRQQMEQYYEETRKRRERENSSDIAVQMWATNAFETIWAQNPSVKGESGGAFSGAGSSSSWSNSSSSSETCSSDTSSSYSSSDNSSSSCSFGD